MKKANNNLLTSILSSAWMIESGFADNMSPFVAELLKGNPVSFPTQESTSYYMSLETGDVSQMSHDDDSAVKANSIAVVSVKGAITKYDQICGPVGTQTLYKVVKSLDKDPRVAAVVFDFDTPGGQATFLNTLATAISDMSKPTLATYSGTCASAGYYLASACDEIYAQEKTDVVGSIGTMISFRDMTKALEKAGIETHTIYSTLSDEKNLQFSEAVKGNYGPVQEMLDEFSQGFIDFVKSNRDEVDDRVFRGRTYTSRRAEKMGLIDGVKKFEEVIDRAKELSVVNKDKISTNIIEENTKTMNLEHIQNALGFEEGIESVDGQVSLSVENMEKINQLLGEKEKVVSEDTQLPVLSVEEVAEIKGKINALETRLGDAESKIVVIGEGTSTDFSYVKKENDQAQEVDSWLDPENKNNKILDEISGK